MQSVLALASGVVLLAATCTGGEDAQPRSEREAARTSWEPGWRGIWPQDSRREAERAQESADRRGRYTWQVGPDGEAVVFRFARKQLGWDRVRGFDIQVPEDATGRLRRWRLIRCVEGSTNADYPEIECSPGKDLIYPATYITIERLLRRNESGIWVVTEAEPTQVHQRKPASREDVRSAVSMFLQRRIRGSGAGEFLSPEGRKEFGRANPLYSPSRGSAYADYELVFVDGPLWPFASFEVGTRMILASGSALEDTLFVGPGRNIRGEKKRLVVDGLRPGLEGP